MSWFVDAAPGEALSLEPVGSDDDGLELVVSVTDDQGQRLERVIQGGDGLYLDLGSPDRAGTEPEILKIELVTRETSTFFGGLWSQWRDTPDAPRGRLAFRAGIGSPSGRIDPATAVDESAGGSDREPVTVGDADSVPPDILVYMVDTLRADRLGAYGSTLGLTPNFDRLADDAVVFRQSRAQTSWTRTAVTSIMTGLYPQSHGVNDRDDGLPATVDTLAEILSRAGYHTVGVVTNGNVGGRFGLGQGFDVYQHLRESNQRRDVHILSDQVDEWLARWLTTLGPRPSLRDRETAPPFFLYAHVTDPHAPYTPHEPYRSRFAGEARVELGLLESTRAIDRGELAAGPEEAVDLLALYNAEVAFTDEHFGHLMERLKRFGLYDSMMILVVSDHGEEFFEHGDWEHGKTLFDEQLRVPLIIKLPGNQGAGQILDVHAGHVDVMPTMLEILGLEGPETLDGKSLLPAIQGQAIGGATPLAFLALENQEMRSVIVGRQKLISDSRSVDRLYALDVDPGEQNDLASEQVFQPWPAVAKAAGVGVGFGLPGRDRRPSGDRPGAAQTTRSPRLHSIG